jgi:hypothetical protein
MKQTSTLLLAAFCMLAFNFSSNAQVSGTVFRDFNGNGAKDNTATFNEIFVAGVTVKAFTASNTQIGPVITTSATGAYNFTAAEIPATTKVRIEFSGLGVGDFNSFNGTGNGTNVQFATAGAGAVVNYAVNLPADYSQANPAIATTVFTAGDPTAVGFPSTGISTAAIRSSPYDFASAITTHADLQTVGSVWGLAYNSKTKRLFSAAFVKRHTGFGPSGIGGVYVTNTVTNTTVPLFNLATLYTLAATAVPTNAARGFNNNPTTLSIDAFGWNNVGKAGLGDLDIADDGNSLFTVNLFTKRVIKIDITNFNLTGTVPAAGDISLLPAYPATACTNGTDRPFGLGFNKGELYLGVVCDANTGTNANLTATIYKFNFTANTWSTVLTFPLNYQKGYTHQTTNSNWLPWTENEANLLVSQTGGFEGRVWAQPILSDVEFDVNNDMIIGFADKGAHMLGAGNRTLGSAAVINGVNGGDLLRAGFNGATYTIENAGTTINGGGSGIVASPANNGIAPGLPQGQGLGGGEYYGGDFFPNHAETSLGSAALYAGSGQVVIAAIDPLQFESGGYYKLNNGTGQKAGTFEIYNSFGNIGTMGKAAGLGAIELLSDLAPVQIGNRIWLDTNGDGIQGADETTAGVPTGTTVTLRSPGVDGIYGNGDDQTTTTTTDAAGNYYFSTLSAADNRKPATWLGVGNTILPGYDYRIEVAVPVGNNITVTNASGNVLDNIDNDASLNGTSAIVVFNTGNTNHNFDIGFKTLASLGNKVWLDEGAGGGTRNNGVQDGTEPGVAGVPVTLYLNGPNGTPGDADDILVGSTITDAFGMYMFENLVPSSSAQTEYNVRVTPPANYSFTVQTNTVDDNSTTGASTTGSDVSVLGVSYSINLSAGENNPNIDAGLIFRAAPVLSSIGDKVWFDANGDGNNDGGAAEPGVAGVTVTLFDQATGNVIAVTTTDANGNYSFNNLPNGTYQVGFSAPAGTVLSPNTGGTTPGNGTTNSDADPATGRTGTITISAPGTQITGIDAGLRNDPKGAIGDFVWNDVNRDGIQDAGEPGVAGVLITLYNVGPDGVIGGGDDGSTLTTTTDATGYYVFPNLDPGKYIVVASQVTGYTLSLKDVTAANPGGDSKDSDFDNGTGFFAGTYTSGVKELKPTAGGVTRDMTVDLGIYLNTPPNTTNTLGDKVWNDLNKNGIQDAGEPGVPNVTVRLLDGAGNPVNNPTTPGKPYVTTTDANGNYKFVDLIDGNYIVEFANIPAGYSFTNQDAVLATDATDSDAKTTTGRTGVINIDAGGLSPTTVNITNVDAGISQGTAAGTASLGNRVWYDVNDNGLQDAGELGVSNVRCELLDGAGAAVDSDPVTAGVQPYIVYTNGLGEYLFTGLAAGDYTVRFSNFPAGYTSAAANANAGTNDAVDADASFTGASVTATTTATTGTYTLQTGEDNLTVDMRIVPAAGTNSVGNFVWNDQNGDGKQDAGEPGVQGVTVTLYTNGADGIAGTADDVVAGVTTTDSLGRYSFVGLPNGNYNVGFSNLPAGFNFTAQNVPTSTAANGSDASDAGGRTGTVALTGGTNIQDLDAGIVTTRAALGNFVWLDTNGDGIQDATEPGVSGVTVTLFAADGTTVLASTITDEKGKYYFGNLTPGSYVVGFTTVPANLVYTQQNTPGDNQNNTNSDANPVTGKTAVIALVAGETDLTIDAGLKPNRDASVGDLVWNDLNGDGIQNANEPGIPGIIVTLYDAANNPVGTAVTDGNGKYLISNVPAGTGYYIVFSNLPGTALFTSRTDNVSNADGTLGSDPDAGTGRTSAFNLTAGQYLPNVDAGIRNVQLLPVRLVSFTAQPQGSQVALQWVVEEQSNIVSYEVEFSKDGSSFNGFTSVPANNNLTAVYNAVHSSPAAGINYYRLKIVDKNGIITYSIVRKVNLGKISSVSVYPNPVREEVNITLTAAIVNKAATISILSIDGKLVSAKQLVAASQTETINVSKLASGKYIVRIVTNNEVINKTIEVIR